MEESSDSENPATGKMSGSQVNTDSDSGSEYASAEEELGEGTEDGGRAVSPTQSAPASHAASHSECSGQVIMKGGKDNIGSVHNSGTIGQVGHNYYGKDRLQDIAARTSANLERACPQGYVRTRGYDRALDAVRKHHCCIITGTSGSGKTTLARHLLLTFKAEGFEAIELIQPSECECLPWEEIRQEKRRLVLLVDNVVGAGNFEDELRKKWEIQLKPMKPFIECRNVLVILASRANIYAAIKGEEEYDQVLYEAPEVSLGGKDGQLSNQEKEEILRKTLEFHQAKLPDWVSINNVIRASNSVTKIGFPQVCVYLAKNPSALSNPWAFFQNPVQFLRKEFQKMKKDDKLSYFVLILVLLQEGTLFEVFMKAKRNKKVFIEVADLVGLSKYPGYGIILERAKQLCESYLEYDSQSRFFSFTHQSVWDVLFSDMCHSDFEKAASVCTFKQLVMYVRTDPMCEESEEFVYVVDSDDWPILIERLLQELTSGDADLACSHPCLQHPDFVQELLTDTNISRLLVTKRKKKIISMTYNKLESLEGSATFFHPKSHEVTAFSFQSCIPYLILGRCSSVAKHILQSAQFQALSPSTQSQLLNEALPCALYVSDFDMVEWLLDRGAVPSQECVRVAGCAEQEHVGLVERALQRDRVLSAELLTEMAWVAWQTFRPRTLELVLSLLPKSATTQAELDRILAEVFSVTYPNKRHHCDIPFLRTYETQYQLLSHILSILKKAGAQFRTHIDPHTAAGHPDPRPLSEWLEHKVDLSVRDNSGYTLLHHAAETGALSNVQALLEVMKSTGQLTQLVNVRTRRGETALHLAAEKGRLAVIEALLKKGADASVIEYTNKTALSVLASCWQWEMEGYMSPSEDQMAASSSSHSSGFQSQAHVVNVMTVKDLLRMLVTSTISVDDAFFGNPYRMAFHDNQTLLNEASERGHCLLVEVLVERGVDVNVRDGEGRTPMHCAAKRGHVDVLEVLSKKEAQLDARDSEGQTALHVAANRGHFPVVNMLIQNKMNINTADKRERTPLHEAAEEGHDQVVKCLLDNGAAVNAADEDGRQPLHLAAGEGHFSVVKCLVEGGASVNAKDRDERTCLHIASDARDVSTLELLFTYGADVDVTDNSGNNMLHSLAVSKASSYSRESQANTARMAPLVKSLGGLVNCQNKQGDTPVMLAVKNKNCKVLRELLRLQCDLSIRNDAGNTALHLFAAQGPWWREKEAAEECMSTLAEKGVEVLNVKNLNGDVPLLLAARSGSFILLKEILKQPVDLSVKSKGGNTSLHELVCGMSKSFTSTHESVSEIVQKLVRKCPDLINSTNDEGDTPVLTAARNGHWFLLSLFLMNSADFSVKCKGGNSVLHELACRLDYWEIERDESVRKAVESIVERCADLINSTNDEGETPVLNAARRGWWFLLFLFLKHSLDFSVKCEGGNSVLHELAYIAYDYEIKRDESIRKAMESIVESCADLINSTNDEGDTPVLIAARYRRWFLVSLFLKHSADFSVKDKGGNSILHKLVCELNEWVIERDESDEKVVESIVERCADLINSTNDEGDIPVLIAAKEGRWFLLSLFLKQQRDVRVCDRRGNTLLHCLAESTPYKQPPVTVQAIIAKLAELVDRANEEGDTPMIVAARRGNEWMVRELVALQCNVTLKNKRGETALFLAIKSEHFPAVDIVEMLLKQDVFVNIQAEECSLLLHTETGIWFLERKCRENEAWRKAIQTFLEKCKFLASCPNSSGETPLYLAFLHGKWCVADLLLEQAGSSVDYREGGLTDKPQEATGLSLAQEGVRTPLHGLAASMQRNLQYDASLRERVSLWVKRFSHWVNHQDTEGNTPILIALREGNFHVAEQLVQCGADLSVTDAKGNTVLHFLTGKTVSDRYCNIVKDTKANEAVAVKVTELAKAAGVTPLTPNKKGKTALDVLRQWQEIIRKYDFFDQFSDDSDDSDDSDVALETSIHWYCFLRDLWLSEEK